MPDDRYFSGELTARLQHICPYPPGVSYVVTPSASEAVLRPRYAV
jgi:hypothetical protein